LTIAQNNLPGYQNNASEATSDAQSTAITSSEQASYAVNGDIKDARKAKRLYTKRRMLSKLLITWKIRTIK